MSMCIVRDMAKDKEFIKLFKNTPKEEKTFFRATILEEANEFIEEIAVDEFGLDPRNKGMAVSKLILIAKDCLKKQKNEE